jgi:hypothetical protein
MRRVDKQINLPMEGVFMAVNFGAVFYAISNYSMPIQFLFSQTDSPSTSPANPSAKAESQPIAERVPRMGRGKSEGAKSRNRGAKSASAPFEFPRDSGNSNHRGTSIENGRGQVLGGQVPPRSGLGE